MFCRGNVDIFLRIPLYNIEQVFYNKTARYVLWKRTDCVKIEWM